MPEKKNSIKKTSLHVDPQSGKFLVSDIVSLRATRSSAPRYQAQRTASPHIPKSPRGGEDDRITRWFTHTPHEAPPSKPRTPVRKPAGNRFLFSLQRISIAVLVLVLIAGSIGYYISAKNAKLYVTVEPKTERRHINTQITIKTSASETAVPGERVAFSTTQDREFPASELRTVERKASGTVIISNAYSSAPQRLVATTRLEATDGKIFRIIPAVTVPGATIKNGKVSAPGIVEARAEADKPGEGYNVSIAEFTIPGFKGTPQYAGFSARTKGAFTGGFIGKIPTASKSDILDASTTLGGEAQAKIIEEFTKKIPHGFILVEGAQQITSSLKPTEAEDAATTSGNTVKIQILVNAQGIIFRPEDIGEKLAQTAGLDPETFRLANTDALTFTVLRKDIPGGEMTVSAVGEAVFVWQIPTSELAERLSQATAPDMFDDIFMSYAGIERAEVRFSPRWTRTIPQDPSHITVSLKEH